MRMNTLIKQKVNSLILFNLERSISKLNSNWALIGTMFRTISHENINNSIEIDSKIILTNKSEREQSSWFKWLDIKV